MLKKNFPLRERIQGCSSINSLLGQLESPVLSLAGWRAKLAGQADTYYDRNNYSGLNLIFFRWRE